MNWFSRRLTPPDPATTPPSPADAGPDSAQGFAHPGLNSGAGPGPGDGPQDRLNRPTRRDANQTVLTISGLTVRYPPRTPQRAHPAPAPPRSIRPHRTPTGEPRLAATNSVIAHCASDSPTSESLARSRDNGIALLGLDLRLTRGRVLGIVGASGSGKSTLTRAILGLLPPTTMVRGSIQLLGHEIVGAPDRDLAALRGRRVGIVMQEPAWALNPVQRIGSALREAITIHRPMNRTEAHREALTLLERVHLPDPARIMSAYPHHLSGGMRQRVCVALALANQPDLLILDEPTTALDSTAAAELLALLHELVAQDMTMLLVSHDLPRVAAIADDIAIIEDGWVTERAPTPELLRDPRSETARILVTTWHERMRTPRPAPAPLPVATPAAIPAVMPAPGLLNATTDHTTSAAHTQGTRPLLLVDRLTVTTPTPRTFGAPWRAEPRTLIHEAVLSLSQGECLALIGESGAGKSTLLHTVMDSLRAPHPAIAVSLRPDPGCGGVSHIAQAAGTALDPRIRVGESITEPMDILGVTGTAAEEALAESLRLTGLNRVRDLHGLLASYPGQLSGGERQRAVFARALVTKPQLLLIDEPFTGLDVRAQLHIEHVLADLRTSSHPPGILLVTHDLGSAARLADRIAVMQAGRIIETAPTWQLLSQPQTPLSRALLAAIVELAPLAVAPPPARRPVARPQPPLCPTRPPAPQHLPRVHPSATGGRARRAKEGPKPAPADASTLP